MHPGRDDPQAPQGRWQRAMRSLARAQAAFNAIERTADASDAAFRRAWMGLWRAERYQLALMRREQES
jgi:hypothetical protein